jgi:hypothetical protein
LPFSRLKEPLLTNLNALLWTIGIGAESKVGKGWADGRNAFSLPIILPGFPKMGTFGLPLVEHFLA